jgi:excinuclease ABC subunit A
MVDTVLAMPEDTKLMILAPVVSERKGEFVDFFQDLQAQGFVRFRVRSGGGTANAAKAEIFEVDQLPALKKNDKHSIEVVVDRIKVRPDIQQRLAESFETALRLADGKAMIVDMDTGKEMIFSSKFACPVCSYSLQELEPRLFSFNNPMGACPSCDGLGHQSFFLIYH